MIKYFKPFVFIICLWPLGTIILDIYYNELGAEPVKKIMNHFGEWTLIFICLTLTMSPLKRITNLSFWIKFRRMLGLFVFFYATIHLLTYVGLDYRFDWQPIFDDVIKKKYVFIGFAAWLLLVPLAITSSQKMMKLLKNNWKKIQHNVGGYEVENSGVSLFSKIDGDYFSVLGIPILQLIDYLINRGVIKQ